MTDLEIVRKCAEKMGLHFMHNGDGTISINISHPDDRPAYYRYDPLKDDAQAMALVKRCGFGIEWHDGTPVPYWAVFTMNYNGDDQGTIAHDPDLNRAICLCVAGRHD